MNFTLYNSEEIERLLRNLEPLQDPIELASQAFIQLGENGFQNRLVQDWRSTFEYYSSPANHAKRLSLLYLANDVIQKCKKSKASGYIDGFKDALIYAFEVLVKIRDEQTITAANNLVEIWRSRRVYPKEAIKQMQDVLSSFSSKSALKGDQDKGQEIPEGLIRIPGELVAFNDAMRELDKWKSKTLEAETKIRASLREEYLNEDEANFHLSEYKKSLELEQKKRTNLLNAEVEMLRALDTDHMKYTHNLKKIGALIDEIERII